MHKRKENHVRSKHFIEDSNASQRQEQEQGKGTPGQRQELLSGRWLKLLGMIPPMSQSGLTLGHSALQIHLLLMGQKAVDEGQSPGPPLPLQKCRSSSRLLASAGTRHTTYILTLRQHRGVRKSLGWCRDGDFFCGRTLGFTLFFASSAHTSPCCVATDSLLKLWVALCFSKARVNTATTWALGKAVPNIVCERISETAPDTKRLRVTESWRVRLAW